MVAKATDAVTLDGNLPSDYTGTDLERVVNVYDGAGTERSLTLTFAKTAGGWSVDGVDDNGARSSIALAQGQDGILTPSGPLTIGAVAVDLSKVSGYATFNSMTVSGQNGAAVGKLESYTLGNDGSLIGSFSNGTKEVLAKIALAKFSNPAGLEKAGGSSYVATGNSGGVQLASIFHEAWFRKGQGIPAA